MKIPTGQPAWMVSQISRATQSSYHLLPGSFQNTTLSLLSERPPAQLSPVPPRFPRAQGRICRQPVLSPGVYITFPPDPTVTKDKAETQEHCHSKCILTGKGLPSSAGQGGGELTGSPQSHALLCAAGTVRSSDPLAFPKNVSIHQTITLSTGRRLCANMLGENACK